MGRIPLGIVALATLLTACSHDSTAPVPSKGILITFDLNTLDAAAVISVDGYTYGTVATNQPIEIQVPVAAQTLTYVITFSPIMAPQDVQPDIIGATANVPITGSSFTIGKVISGTTYFDPIVTNNSGSVAYIGIFRGGELTCLAPTPTTAPFSKELGYWRLTSDTELRAYNSLGCGGSYHAWTYTDLSASDPNSGVISLSLTSIP
jgi:hypothetical protein